MDGQTLRQFAEELFAYLGPRPSTPVDALTHTLKVFADRPDDEIAITATNGTYGKGVITGLTWRDLRALARLVERADQ